MPDIDLGNINIFLVIGIIVIAIASVIIISKCFNTRKKNNAKELVDKKISDLRK